MPLEVGQDAGEKGIEVKTTPTDGQGDITVDKSAKAESQKDLADIQSSEQIGNQVEDFVATSQGPSGAFKGGAVDK